MVKTKKISYIAILTALASAVYYVESFLPLPVAIPGARWGFSNFPLLLSVVTDVGLTNTLYIALLKTLLGSILSGRFYHQCFDGVRWCSCECPYYVDLFQTNEKS